MGGSLICLGNQTSGKNIPPTNWAVLCNHTKRFPGEIAAWKISKVPMLIKAHAIHTWWVFSGLRFFSVRRIPDKVRAMKPPKASITEWRGSCGRRQSGTNETEAKLPRTGRAMPTARTIRICGINFWELTRQPPNSAIGLESKFYKDAGIFPAFLKS